MRFILQNTIPLSCTIGFWHHWHHPEDTSLDGKLFESRVQDMVMYSQLGAAPITSRLQTKCTVKRCKTSIIVHCLTHKLNTVKQFIIGDDLIGEIGEFKKFAKINRHQNKIKT